VKLTGDGVTGGVGNRDLIEKGFENSVIVPVHLKSLCVQLRYCIWIDGL